MQTRKLPSQYEVGEHSYGLHTNAVEKIPCFSMLRWPTLYTIPSVHVLESRCIHCSSSSAVRPSSHDDAMPSFCVAQKLQAQCAVRVMKFGENLHVYRIAVKYHQKLQEHG